MQTELLSLQIQLWCQNLIFLSETSGVPLPRPLSQQHVLSINKFPCKYWEHRQVFKQNQTQPCLLILKGRGQLRWCWEPWRFGSRLVLPPPAGMLQADPALRTSPPLPAGNKSCGFWVGEWIHIQSGIYGDFMDPTNASLPPFSGNCTIPAVHSLCWIALFLREALLIAFLQIWVSVTNRTCS